MCYSYVVYFPTIDSEKQSNLIRNLANWFEAKTANFLIETRAIE